MAGELNRWSPLFWGGVMAIVANAALYLLFRLAGAHPDSTPSLLFPYLSAGGVFWTACAWIVAAVWQQPDPFSVRRKVHSERRNFQFFCLAFAVLLLGGMAPGHPGARAVWAINWY